MAHALDISCGPAAISMITGWIPLNKRQHAAVSPAGPAPTMRTSAVDGRFDMPMKCGCVS